MERNFEAKFQIGKAGLTAPAIETFKIAFKTHHQLRISVLKSAGRNKENVIKIASEIQGKMGSPCAVRVIGFTIIFVHIKKAKK
jgi:RNA-binding protein YhbY